MNSKISTRLCVIVSIVLQVLSFVSLIIFFIFYHRKEFIRAQQLVIAASCFFSHGCIVAICVARYHVLIHVFDRLLKPHDSKQGLRGLVGITITSLMWVICVGFRELYDVNSFGTMHGQVYLGLTITTCIASIINFMYMRKYVAGYMAQIESIQHTMPSRRSTLSTSVPARKTAMTTEEPPVDEAGMGTTILIHKMTGLIIMLSTFIGLWIFSPWPLVAYNISTWIYLYGNVITYQRFLKFLAIQSCAINGTGVDGTSTLPRGVGTTQGIVRPSKLDRPEKKRKSRLSIAGQPNRVIIAYPSDTALSRPVDSLGRPERTATLSPS